MFILENINLLRVLFRLNHSTPLEIPVLVHTCNLALRHPSSFIISFHNKKNCVVLQADEAFHIGAAASRESYLNMEKIIDVAIQSGAQVKKT